jgi:hypothetical protein
MEIQGYPEEFNYANTQIASRAPDDHSFLGTFCLACLRANSQNYEVLRMSLRWLMKKYPLSPEFLEEQIRRRNALGS